MYTKKKIERAAEKADWSCIITDVDPKTHGAKYEISFQRFTERGQDSNFEFSVSLLEDISMEVYNAWEGYDPDEAAYLWLGPDGHGKNGAPYYAEDVLADAKEVDEYLKKLFLELDRI